jgi:hypothetical protein
MTTNKGDVEVEEELLGQVRHILHNSDVSPELEDILNSEIYDEVEGLIHGLVERIVEFRPTPNKQNCIKQLSKITESKQ